MTQHQSKGRPKKYDFDIAVGESQKYINADSESVRSAAWGWSQKHKKGRWKYSVEKHNTNPESCTLKRLK